MCCELILLKHFNTDYGSVLLLFGSTFIAGMDLPFPMATPWLEPQFEDFYRILSPAAFL